MKITQLIGLGIALAIFGVPVFAEEPSGRASANDVAELKRQLEALQQAVASIAESQSGGGSADVAALKAQLEELDQKVKVLEREKEIEKEAAAEKAKTTPVITANAKDGFSLKSPDNAFTLKVGGWVAYDIGFFDQDEELRLAVGDEQDGTGFRSTRLRLSGTLFNNIYYQTEYEFAGENGQDTPAFFDTYVALKDVPYGGERKGELRIGHFREPFSLEELTSQPARTFQERSLASAFYPSRNAGIQWSDSLLGEEKKERLYYALGIFKTTDNWPSSNDSDEDQGYNITARVAGLPYYALNGERLVHIGAGYSLRNPDGAVVGWSARPEARLSLFRYADTERVQGYRLRDARADDINLFNVEFASVIGPFMAQAEYTKADVDTTFDGSRSFDGYYAQLSYLLTGEHRTYRHDTATFDRITPKRNFGWGKTDGWGAWEVALRYSDADLTDGGVRGGEHSSWTAGLRWYLNPNTHITLNYIINDVEHDLYEGEYESLQLRTQVAF
ncbi:MAG TPA: porin [Candidatus Hydrogenedentes bacterium]|mgnify:CR=1 FL=1|nr:porin [Candidatus Hydrogenedentota bacterium]